MKYTGLVDKQLLNIGSKSEYCTAVLITETTTLPLRRVDGNPFRDDVLESLIGKRISCDGYIYGAHLVICSWNIL